ncbi:MAG: efflux transporter outer membrane subunit [Mariniblastus sp.]
MLQDVSVRLGLVWWLLVLPLCVSGCAGRNFVKPLVPAAPQFSDSGISEAPNRWWVAFGDQELEEKINQAVGGNYTLAAALQRVRAARALTRREASDLFPDLNGISDAGFVFGPGRDSERYGLGLDAAYQVDLWGEIQSRVDAERFRANATCYDAKAIALTLSSEIARNWFSLQEAHAQVKLLKDQIKTNRTGLELQESRFGLGLIRSADVLRQRQLLESTLEQSVVAEARIEVLEHQLALLLGEMPQTATYETGSELPELPPLPNTGLPSELLQRRPDVLRDYLAFEAADRDLASAISSQYPRISLSGAVQNIADSPESIFRDWFASLGGQLVAPLLDGGQRRAEVDRNAALVFQRFSEYSQTMLIAFREVEDSLAQEKYQVQRIRHLNEQVKLAGQASAQLREQYLIGDAEYLDILSASTTQQSLQRQLLSAQLELVLIRVSLYLALAGEIEPASPNERPVVLPDRPALENEEVEEVDPQEPSEETTDLQDALREAADTDLPNLETEPADSQN